MPFVRKVRFLTLAMIEAEVVETCVTRQGIALNVRAVIAFKVGNDPESIVNAGQRFLSDQDQMSVLTGRIFAGHLRSIIGSMTVEEIVTERQKLATEVLDDLKAGDGQDRPDRGLAADPVHRRRRQRLHRGDVRAAQGRDPAAGADRAGPGDPGRRPRPSRRRSASRPSTPGRRRSCRRSTRRRSTGRRPRRRRPGRWPRRTPSRRCSPRRPNWPARRRAAPAAAGGRGRQAGRGRGGADQGAGRSPRRSGCGSWPRPPPPTTAWRWTGC